MFGVEELTQIAHSPQFLEDRAVVLRSLALERVGQRELFHKEAVVRLRRFVECVLSSAPEWDSTAAGDLCRMSAEIAESLSISWGSADMQRNMRFRSALLFELADLPAISSALLEGERLAHAMSEFFTRRGLFGALTREVRKVDGNGSASIVELALGSDAAATGEYVQGYREEPSARGARLFETIAKELALDYSATELHAFEKLIQTRAEHATRNHVDANLFQALRTIRFPSELWQAQRAAVDGGLIDDRYNSWGLAAPTGRGKSFLARLLIVDALQRYPGNKILYMVPSRALVYEVASRLSSALDNLGIEVVAVTPQLVEMDDEESSQVGDSSVIVLTPEKADMLLRLGEDFFSELCLVVVDEAHHIESSTRGILLEMYLWRLKQLLKSQKVRYIFLSAVAPNIGEIAKWMGDKSGSVLVEQRPTRMRAGVYRIKGSGRSRAGVIDYSDGVSITLISSDSLQSGSAQLLLQLAQATSGAGPVLVVAKGKKECEKLARLMLDNLAELGRPTQPPTTKEQTELLERLDSRLEREMYSEVLLRKLLKSRVAYHHAGLPPRVRTALEDAIRLNLVDYVFATTTLAEGVNCPFATVIVQSLALREAPQKGRPARYQPVTPRIFWNIAGRAGRPGFDREGQVLLFEPTLGLDKVSYVLGDYLNPKLTATEAVKSALGEAIEEIAGCIDSGELAPDDLKKKVLPAAISKRTQGAVNLIRVSLVHVKASGLKLSPEEILESTFAAMSLDERQLKFAEDLFLSQEDIVTEFLNDPGSPDDRLVAELGLSIETLSELKDWAAQLQDWQIETLRRLLPGGVVDLERAAYIVGPVAKRMAELEGPRLGGFLSEVIISWVSGAPFASMRSGLSEEFYKPKSVEDLISVIYSRVQYLLPWGLYAADRLIEAEATRRRIPYLNEVRSLAYLVDGGVPSFDALKLVHLDFERTDASRIAAEYHRRGGLRLGVEVISWLANQSRADVARFVLGPDRRRPDFDIDLLLGRLKGEIA